MKKMVLIYLALMLFLGLFSPKVLAFGEDSSFQWWNSTYNYRASANISTGSYNRTGLPIEMEVNFTSLLDGGNFDNNSVRVIEYNSSGYIKREAPSQFDQYTSFNKSNNAIGEVVWIMNGTTNASTTRYYYIYFSKEEDGTKEVPTYPTDLNYSWDEEELEVNNSNMEWKIDTNRSSMTSGFYYAKIKNGITIFNAGSSAKTAEYSGYNNGTDTGFNLYGNMTLVYRGPVRLTFQQVGNETVFGSNEQTYQSQIRKNYVFYENNSWVKIDQNLTNTSGSSISRSSDYPYPLTLDSGRILSGGAGYTQPTSWSIDPFSSAFAYSLSGNGGLGIINYMENNTDNFKSSIDIINDALNIKLTASTTISSWIRQAALLFFSESDSLTSFENFRNRTVSPAQKNLGSAEFHYVIVNITTGQAIYNRNETMVLRVNITQDPFNTSSSVYAVLNNATSGTSDDVTIQLFDDGFHNDSSAGDKIFGGNYTLPASSNTGSWNFTAKIYDVYNQEINQTTIAFNVTYAYNVNSSISNRFGYASRQVLAEVTVRNYRNDTYISSAAIDCSFNGTLVTNKTDSGNGTYYINFTAPTQLGKYILQCNATKSGNNATGDDYFYSESAKTSLNITITPYSFDFSNITQDYYPSLLFKVNVTNPGEGVAHSAEINISKPSSWTSNSTTISCEDMLPNAEFISYVIINTSAGANPSNYTINATVYWNNLDYSTSNSTNTSYVNISSNPILAITPGNITDTINEGTDKSVYFLINATGNDIIHDLNISSYGFPSEWNVAFPSNITSLSSGSWQNISANFSIPEGYTNGTYTGFFNVNNTNVENTSINITITVPVAQTWSTNQTLCQEVIMKNAAGTLCDILVANTGNQILNFTLTPSGWENFTSLNELNFTLSKTSQHNFSILYETNDTQGIFYRNYTISSDNGTQTIRTAITVTYGPLVAITSVSPERAEQGSSILINATITDRTQSGLSSVTINVTDPDGNVNTTSMQFLRNDSWTSYYSAYYPSTWGSTLKTGFYNFTVKSIDVLSASNLDTSNFTIYKNLVINMSALSTQYYKCGSGRIYYFIKDLENISLQNTNVTFELKDPSERLIWNNQNQTSTTNSNGTIEPFPTFTITCDDLEGTYKLYSNSTYFDSTTNITLNRTNIYNFTVLTPIEAAIYSDSSAYPNSTLDFLITIRDNNKQPLDPDSLNLTIYNPSKGVEHSANISQMIKLSNATGLYYYSYNISSSTQEGVYLVVLNATKSQSSATATSVFSVTKSKVRVEVDTVPLWYATNAAKFFVTVYDDNNKLVDAESVNLTVYDPDLNPLSVTFTINQFSTGIYYASWTIPSSPINGQYMIKVNASVNGSYAQDITTFRILQGGPFRFEIDAPTTGYIGESMAFTVNATNEGDGPAESQFTCWIDDGITNHSQISWSKLISSGEEYYEQKTILLPSSLSEGAYSLYCQLHVVNGSMGDVFSQDTFLAEVSAPAAPTGPAAAGAPSGGVSGVGIKPSAKTSLKISKIYPSLIQMERGAAEYLIIFVENDGGNDLNDIDGIIEGIDSTWVQTIQKIPTLKPGESSSIIKKITVPPSSESKDYQLSIKMSSKEGATDSQPITLRVYQSKKELILPQIEQLKSDLLKMQLQTMELKLKGQNVDSVISLLEEVNKQITEAENYYTLEDYMKSSEQINLGRNTLNKAIYELSILTRAGRVFLDFSTKQILITFFGMTLIVSVFIVGFFLFKQKEEKKRVENIYPAMQKLPIQKQKPYIQNQAGVEIDSIKFLVDDLRNSVEELRNISIEKEESKKDEAEAEKTQEMLEQLEKERSNIKDIIGALDEQHKEKIITKKTYDELKEKNQGLLKIIEEKINDLSIGKAAIEPSLGNEKNQLMSAINKQYENGLINKELMEKLIKRLI